MQYNLEYFEKMLRLNSATAEHISAIRWDFVKEIEPKTVLDYGSGPGWFRAFRPDYVEHVDTYDIGQFPQTGIRRDVYDLITFWDVIEHIKNLSSLSSLWTKTKYVALSIPIRYKGLKLKEWKHYKPGEHFHYFSEETIKGYFRSIGFECCKFEYPEVTCGIRKDIGSGLFKRKKDIIVFTNGVFDLLHPGHLYMLQRAKDLGDKLIVGVDSDRVARRAGKEHGRPIKSQEVRRGLIEALGCVDKAYIFDDFSGLLSKIHPDYIVKGGDYQKEDIVGKEFVESYGGKAIILPYLKDQSTTNLIERILDRK